MILKRIVCSLVLTALLGFGVATAPAVGTSADPAAGAAAAQVTIDNFTFAPATLKVAVGTTVTWVNKDDMAHNVVSADKVFKSTGLDTGDKFSFTFTKAGKYPYICGLHPKMHGEVDVQ
jgi:plastocyanin